MFLKGVKQFFKDPFLDCNTGTQLSIYLTIGLILLILRQFDSTYYIGSNQYLNDLKLMFMILPWFCTIKYWYDIKYFKTAYLLLFFFPLLFYFSTTPLYKDYLAKYHNPNNI